MVSLHELSESPLDNSKTINNGYASNKIKKIDSAMRREHFTNAEISSESENKTPEETVLNSFRR